MRTMTGMTAVTCALALAAIAATGLGSHAQAQDYRAIVAAPDRTDADRQNDKRRDPTELLAFTGAKPGMMVLDMGAGGGYSTELMARAVAPNGKVYGQDGPGGSERTRARYDERAKSPAMANTVRVLRPYDDPIPPDVKNLDLITFFFVYHDVTYMPVDRAKMDKAMFDALKPGGVIVVADHMAKEGAGATVGKTLHRIEPATVRKELEAAGFKFVASGDFLRHPDDPKDAPVFRSPTPVDEFVMKFQKP